MSFKEVRLWASANIFISPCRSKHSQISLRFSRPTAYHVTKKRSEIDPSFGIENGKSLQNVEHYSHDRLPFAFLYKWWARFDNNSWVFRMQIINFLIMFARAKAYTLPNGMHTKTTSLPWSCTNYHLFSGWEENVKKIRHFTATPNWDTSTSHASWREILISGKNSQKSEHFVFLGAIRILCRIWKFSIRKQERPMLAEIRIEYELYPLQPSES